MNCLFNTKATKQQNNISIDVVENEMPHVRKKIKDVATKKVEYMQAQGHNESCYI